jgi:hypothetical protein
MKALRGRRSVRLAAAAILAGAVGAGTLLTTSLAGTNATSTSTAAIARTTANGFRVGLTAVKGTDESAPSATVKVAAYARRNGVWERLGQPLVVGEPGGFFWYVVRGPHSLRLGVATDVPERIRVRLLVTPSIGWSDVYRFHVENGILVRG